MYQHSNKKSVYPFTTPLSQNRQDVKCTPKYSYRVAKRLRPHSTAPPLRVDGKNTHIIHTYYIKLNRYLSMGILEGEEMGMPSTYHFVESVKIHILEI